MTHDDHGQGDAAQELGDLEAAWELTPTRWRCAHCGDRITGESHVWRQQPSSAPATAAEEPGQPTGRDWREELETTRLARLAVARLRRDLAAGADPQPRPAWSWPRWSRSSTGSGSRSLADPGRLWRPNVNRAARVGQGRQIRPHYPGGSACRCPTDLRHSG